MKFTKQTKPGHHTLCLDPVGRSIGRRRLDNQHPDFYLPVQDICGDGYAPSVVPIASLLLFGYFLSGSRLLAILIGGIRKAGAYEDV